MEPVFTIHKTADRDEAKFVFTGIIGSNQETDALKVDLSTLEHADPSANERTCTVEGLRWHINGQGTLNINLAGPTPVKVAELCKCGQIDAGKLADAGGNVSFTTTNFASGDAYMVEVTIRKATGFTQTMESDECNKE